jgi:hypothetical protein
VGVYLTFEIKHGVIQIGREGERRGQRHIHRGIMK